MAMNAASGKQEARDYAKLILSGPAGWDLDMWRQAAIILASDVIAYVEGAKPMTGSEPVAGAGISKERKAHGE